MFFNVHTHQTGGNNPFAIVNLHQDFDAIPGNGYYSAGLHPWYLSNEDPVDGIQRLAAALEKPQVLAVGECGLDKVCETDYGLQQNCFRQQVQLANKCLKPLILHCVQAYGDTCRILTEERVQVPVIFHGFSKNSQLARQLANQYHRPLILHCVRAFADTCRILTEERVQVPVIFHGFSKNSQLARQLVQQGYYLSFGKSLWHKNAATVFNDIALEHIFLETDAANLEIGDAYARASTIKQISGAAIKAAIDANAQLVFGLTIP